VLHDAQEDEHIFLQPLDFPCRCTGWRSPGTPRRRAEAVGRAGAAGGRRPCLRLEHAARTALGHQTLVYGLGELHLRLLLERLKELYKGEISTAPPRIAYRETVSRPAEGHHRHKKQSGGAGQFGEVYLRVEPLARGAGFEFVDAVKGGTIPGVHARGREGRAPGLRRGRGRRLPAGGPARDRVRRQAPCGGQQGDRLRHGRPAALRAAVREAGPLVLEPLVQVEISAPEPPPATSPAT
jgi:elongation factor G